MHRKGVGVIVTNSFRICVRSFIMVDSQIVEQWFLCYSIPKSLQQPPAPEAQAHQQILS